MYESSKKDEQKDNGDQHMYEYECVVRLKADLPQQVYNKLLEEVRSSVPSRMIACREKDMKLVKLSKI